MKLLSSSASTSKSVDFFFQIITLRYVTLVRQKISLRGPGKKLKVQRRLRILVAMIQLIPIVIPIMHASMLSIIDALCPFSLRSLTMHGIVYDPS